MLSPRTHSLKEAIEQGTFHTSETWISQTRQEATKYHKPRPSKKQRAVRVFEVDRWPAGAIGRPGLVIEPCKHKPLAEA